MYTVDGRLSRLKRLYFLPLSAPLQPWQPQVALQLLAIVGADPLPLG